MKGQYMSDKIYGKIMQGVGGLYSVRITEAESDSAIVGYTVSCRARGSFRHNNLSPLAGDNVILSRTRSDGDANVEEYVIEDILDRKNALIRPPISNLDYLFIVFADNFLDIEPVTKLEAYFNKPSFIKESYFKFTF